MAYSVTPLTGIDLVNPEAVTSGELPSFGPSELKYLVLTVSVMYSQKPPQRLAQAMQIAQLTHPLLKQPLQVVLNYPQPPLWLAVILVGLQRLASKLFL